MNIDTIYLKEQLPFLIKLLPDAAVNDESLDFKKHVFVKCPTSLEIPKCLRDPANRNNGVNRNTAVLQAQVQLHKAFITAVLEANLDDGRNIIGDSQLLTRMGYDCKSSRVRTSGDLALRGRYALYNSFKLQCVHEGVHFWFK